MDKGPEKWSDQIVFSKPHLRKSHHFYFVTAVYITVMPRGLVMSCCAKHWKIQIKMTVSASQSLYEKCKARENRLMQRDRTTERNISFLGQLDKQWPISWGFFFIFQHCSMVKDLQESRALWKILEDFRQTKRLLVGIPKMCFICLEEVWRR